jgi:hypothetical protein
VDETVNRCVRELIDLINAAASRDAAVRACRERARDAGFDVTIKVEAVVEILDERATTDEMPADEVPPARRLMPASRGYEVTAADRRFLRSLRIATEDTREEV